MLYLVDQPPQRLRIGDGARLDPLLVANKARAYRFQIRLRLDLGTRQVRDRRFSLGVVREERLAFGQLPGDRGMLGQGAAPAVELCDLGVDGLQGEQLLLVGRCCFDGGLLRSRPVLGRLPRS